MHGSMNINPLNAELNPICYLLALLGAHHFLHVSRIRVKWKPCITQEEFMFVILFWSEIDPAIQYFFHCSVVFSIIQRC